MVARCSLSSGCAYHFTGVIHLGLTWRKNRMLSDMVLRQTPSSDAWRWRGRTGSCAYALPRFGSGAYAGYAVLAGRRACAALAAFCAAFSWKKFILLFLFSPALKKEKAA